MILLAISACIILYISILIFNYTITSPFINNILDEPMDETTENILCFYFWPLGLLVVIGYGFYSLIRSFYVFLKRMRIK